MRQTGWIAAGTLLLALVQGCVVPAAKPAEGDRLLDFALYTLDGQKTSLAAVTRGKVAVVKFGASWCPYCTKQIPHLNQLAAKYPKDLVAVVDIDLQEDLKTVQAYAKKSQVAYTMLLDPRGTGAAIYNISSIPVTLIAGPDGTIAYRGEYTTFRAMDGVVARLVEKLQAASKK
ncbi:MAG TPA: TlpA disulfide reductase family protein [Planctomycetota bacterium]|nr:TlpA disulfide reductase family protein [Planctomycetota bacterium]